MAPTLAQLQALSDDELVAGYDGAAGNTGVGTAFFLDEIHRRQQDVQATKIEGLTERMERWTLDVRRLTQLVTLLTALNVVAAIASVVVALLK